MSVLFGLIAGAAFLATLGLVVAALLAPGPGPWSAIAAAAHAGVTRAVVQGPALRAPRSGRPCAWSVTWVVARGSDVGVGQGDGGPVALERSTAPVVLDVAGAGGGGGGPMVVEAERLLVQAAAGAPPFGLSVADRTLLRTTPRRSYADWAAGAGASPGATFGEVVLPLGAEVELVALGDGQVACLQPGQAAGAAGHAQTASAQRRLRWRRAGWAGLAFIGAAAAASALA